MSATKSRTIVYTQLYNKARYLRMNLNILHTLDGSRILFGLEAVRHRHRLNGKLLVTQLHTALASATGSQHREPTGNQGHPVRRKTSVLIHIHIYKKIICEKTSADRPPIRLLWRRENAGPFVKYAAKLVKKATANEPL